MLNCPARIEYAVWALFGGTCALLLLSTTIRSNRVLHSICLSAFLVSGGLLLAFPAETDKLLTSVESGLAESNFRGSDSSSGENTQSLQLGDSFQETSLSRGIPVLLLIVGALLTLLCWDQQSESAHAPEQLGLLLAVIAAGLLAVAANDLLTIFVATEVGSLATVGLLHASRRKDSAHSWFASCLPSMLLRNCLFFYGLVLLYGLAGTLDLAELQLALEAAQQPSFRTPIGGPLPLIGIAATVLLFTSFGLSVMAVPFHLQKAHVTEEASEWGNIYLSVVPNIVAIAVLYRLFGVCVAGAESSAALIAVVFAVGTIVLGNLSALRTENVWGILSQSAMAHMGVAFAGLAIAMHANQEVVPAHRESSLWHGFAPVELFLFVHCIALLGMFGVLKYAHSTQRPVIFVDDLKGLSRTYPIAGACFLICLFSYVGFPPLAGFWGFLWLFFAAIDARVDPPPTFWELPVQAFAALGVVIVAHIVFTIHLLGRLITAVLIDKPLGIHRAAGGKCALGVALVAAIMLVGAGLFPRALFWLVR